MAPISKALIQAIVYIDSRDVPSDIEDDDVATLEVIMASLADLNDGDRMEFLSLVKETRSSEDDARACEALDSLIEMLSDE